MFPHLKGFNLKQWIEENRGDWGQRRVIWQDSDFIAFVTRGPNRRKDYHINPGDEIFYQLEGELNLHYLDHEKHDLAVLKAGELFLLPGKVPHSPRRADGSWTLVIERKRTQEEQDRFIWPCE
jgi:3-hydroxyanthranilate 3,4-dioxygenase